MIPMTRTPARTSMRRAAGLAARTLTGLLTLALLTAPGAAQGSLLVYAVISQDDAELLTGMFAGETGVDVRFLRGATGELVARVIAERGAPQADVLLGGPSSLHISVAESGALAPYVSPAAAVLPDSARDPDGLWTGFYLTALGIGINEARFAQRYGERPLPSTWEDLLDPAFAGEIVITDPVASSTAYLFVQAQLQRLGWDAGWDYLERLAPLVGQFPSSGGAPPQLVGTGEYTLGVAFVHALARYRAQGFPVTMVVPPATAGEVGAVSIIAGGPNPENARRFVDFILSPRAQQAFVDQSLTTPLHPDVALPEAAVPLGAIDLIAYDPTLAGEQRDEVLLRWQSVVD
jgi:iron(III) transport system substrate-binding protein